MTPKVEGRGGSDEGGGASIFEFIFCKVADFCSLAFFVAIVAPNSDSAFFGGVGRGDFAQNGQIFEVGGAF